MGRLRLSAKKAAAVFCGGFVIVALMPVVAFAATGTIDDTYKYAWSEDYGWINFKADSSNVSVSDSQISGYAWSDTGGWINLAPSVSTYVANDGSGTLSGYAWGETIGYINFSGVTIDSDGYFHGNATTDSGSRISFNCANTSSCGSSDFKVRTSWRPTSTSGSASGGGSSGGGGNGPISGSLAAAPLALTLATATPPVPEKKFVAPNNACSPFTKPLRLGSEDPQVSVVKSFLMFYGFLASSSPTTIFDADTAIAVKKFQSLYASTILTPWGYKKPTGYWYITTRKQANELVSCVTRGSVKVHMRGSLNVRSIPSSKGSIISKLKDGTSVPYYAEDGGWYYVEYLPGKSGWVSGRYVQVSTHTGLE